MSVVIIKRRNLDKRILVQNLFMAVLLWLLASFNYENPDMNNYKGAYEGLINGTFGISKRDTAFWVCMYISARLKLSYSIFIFIYMTVALIILFKGLLKIDRDIHFNLFLYTIFPFFLDIVQIRNFMAMAITIYCIHYLFENTTKSLIKYIIGICIAMLFHFAASCYFLFVLVNPNRKRKFFLILIGVLGIYVCVVRYKIIAINQTITYATKYILKGTKLYTKFLNIGYVVFYVLLLSFCNCNFKNANTTPETKNKVKVIRKIVLFSIAFLPIVCMNVEFFRIYRNLIPVFNMAVCLQLKYMKIENDILIKTIMVVFMLSLFYAFIGRYDLYDVFFTIIKKNYLWG